MSGTEPIICASHRRRSELRHGRQIWFFVQGLASIRTLPVLTAVEIRKPGQEDHIDMRHELWNSRRVIQHNEEDTYVIYGTAF